VQVASDAYPGLVIQPQLGRQAWNPDAFIHAIRDVVTAVEHGRQPCASGEVNLATMRVLFAGLESHLRGVPVAPESITLGV
jgi:predicted dehydrogenase